MSHESDKYLNCYLWGSSSVSEEAAVLYWKVFSVEKYGGVYMDTNILYREQSNVLR